MAPVAVITLALEDVALAVSGHLGFLAEAQVTGVDRPRIGNHLYGGFARDFGTADGERVMVVALTRRHFADLARVTGLAATFAELERLLHADFSTDGDRCAHREVLAAAFAADGRRMRGWLREPHGSAAAMSFLRIVHPRGVRPGAQRVSRRPGRGSGGAVGGTGPG